MKRYEITGNSAEELKKLMGYQSGKQCCKTCQYYEGPNYSSDGGPGNICKLNPAGFIRTEESARCDHHAGK